MTNQELLSILRQKHVRLWLDGERLRYEAPQGAITPELLEHLKLHKAELVELLRVALQTPQAVTPPIQRVDRKGLLPLSFAQQRLWLLDQLEPNLSIYNVPNAFRLKGRLDRAALGRTLEEIHRRHEILRTRFPTVDGEPVQDIAPPGPVDLPVVDLSALPPSEREAESLRRIQEESTLPFALAKGPLVRLRLLCLAEEDHFLLMTMHHIISDAWSRSVFANEFSAIYGAVSRGEPIPLPDLPIQYADFACWQREWLQGPVLQEQLEFWKKQLAGSSLVLELPADQPRPPTQSYRGARVSFQWPRSLADQLDELGRREGVTLFMTVLAAFQTLLHKYTGQEDIIVGSPSAGRNRTETEGLIGFFINTLPLRANLSGNPTFRELLHRTRDAALGAFAHQDVPFEKLVEEMQTSRDMSRAPIFQVMLVLQNAPADNLRLPGLVVESIPVDTATAKFDMIVEVLKGEEGLAVQVEFCTDLFARERIERMAGHLQTLLEAVARDPQQRLGDIPILTASEREQILVEWNRTALEYDREATIHQLVEAQVRRTPDAVALVADKTRLTYEELNARANRLARRLQTLGVGPETLVGICSRRTPEMVVAMLAILKAGGAYVPLDPTYPRERIRFILEDADAPVLLTERKLAAELPSVGARVVYLEEIDAREQSATDLAVAVTGSNLAYTIFTSGSTGRPKGVALEHRNAAAFIAWARTVYSRDDLDGVLFSTSICFDLSVFELFVTLASGGKVILAENALHLTSLRARDEVRLINTVPSAIAELVRADAIPRSAQIVNLAGEPLAQTLVDKIYSLPWIRRVYDLYGPSEDTTYSTFTLRAKGGTATIGRPIANTQLYLLDANMHPVPVGVPGELHLGGDGLARGYLKRPDLTAEKFVPNPFRAAPSARLYKTGDLARFLPDGNVEYIGRMDRQVKVRGYRIELGEIQAVLDQYAGVRESTVIVREDQPGDKRIVAYLVPKEGQSPTPSELREHLRQKLPDYMIPSAFVSMGEMPLTPNGKVDRKSLPSPQQDRTEPGKQFVAPRDALEQQLAKLWEKAFGIQPIGVRDNFFELGGHSLLAVKLFTQIQKLTGKNLPLVTLFQAPTIEQLAEILRKEGWKAPWHCLVPIKPDGSKPPFFCVHGVGGNVVEYYDLAKHVEPDQPFYGIQAIGLDGSPQSEAITLERTAAIYLQEVRAFQPKGPYYLGGSSFGGLVAYEMAQQLVAAGEQVALLAMFDAGGPGYPQYLPSGSAWQQRIARWKHRFSLHWDNILVANGKERFDYICGKAWKWARGKVMWQVWTAQIRLRRLREEIQGFFWPQAFKQIKKAGKAAAAMYVPKPYVGAMTVFRAMEQPPGVVPDRELGWGKLIMGGIQVYDTPGHHGAIVRDPRARKLAEQLTDALHQAHEAAGQAPKSNGKHASARASRPVSKTDFEGEPRSKRRTRDESALATAKN